MALTATVAVAEPDMKSANFLLPYCKVGVGDTKTADVFMAGRCMGLIEGITFMAGATDFCPPTNEVTYNQSTLVVIAYIEARPQRMHEDFRLLAIEGLKNAWPCRP
jgi:hypothetical protein